MVPIFRQCIKTKWSSNKSNIQCKVKPCDSFSYTKWIKGVHTKMAANGFYVNPHTLFSDYGWLVCVMRFMILSK